jgi:hypothetical protein
MADPVDELLIAASSDNDNNDPVDSTAASADDLDDFFSDLGISGDDGPPSVSAALGSSDHVELDLDFGDLNTELDLGLISPTSNSTAAMGDNEENRSGARKPAWSSLEGSEQDDFLSWLQDDEKDGHPRKDTSFSVDSEEDDLPGITLESLAADSNNALAAAALAAVNATKSAGETFAEGSERWVCLLSRFASISWNQC